MSISTFYYGNSNIKVNTNTEGKKETLAGAPLTDFKCVKNKGKNKYMIDVSAPAFDRVDGKEYFDYLITGNKESLRRSIGNIFCSLCENDFTPWDADIKDLLTVLHEYQYAYGVSGFEIKKWPVGIPVYSPRYTKEQSLAALLKFIDRICSFTDDDINNALQQLQQGKSTGRIKPNKKILILNADFFVPARSTSEFNRIISGFVPNLAVCSPTNPPKRKEIHFSQIWVDLLK